MRTAFFVALVFLAAPLATAQESSDPLQAVRDVDNDLPEGNLRDCALCPEMRLLPALPDGSVLAIGRFEVTQFQFEAFVQATGHETGDHCAVWAGTWDRSDNSKSWQDPGIPHGSDHPAVCLSKGDAEAYAAWLSQITGRTYRLPTEREWRFAATAGTDSLYPWQSAGGDACAYANVGDATLAAVHSVANLHACDDTWLYTAPAGMRAPNAWDLYDMIGNAREWASDCLPQDGMDAAFQDCALSPVLGGDYGSTPLGTLTSLEGGVEPPDSRQSWTGFRVVAEIE